MSATARMVSLVWAVLFAGFGSASTAVTVAASEIGPGAVGMTVMVRTTGRLPDRLPMVSTSVLPVGKRALPRLSEADTNVAFAGRKSVRTTPEAGEGPLFEAVTT